MKDKRKFIAYTATILVCALCFAFAELASGDFADIVRAAIWAFVVGNSAEHFAEKK